MQPDIEIYLKDCTHEEAWQWLGQVFNECSPWQLRGKTYRCSCDGIQVTWYTKAVGSWHSLLFDSPATPWKNDLECAQAANVALDVEVRCAPGGWEEEQGEQVADDWLKVTSEGVSPFVWRT